MKIRMKTWQVALALLLSVLVPVCCIVTLAQASQASQGIEEKPVHMENHTDDKEWEDSVGYMTIQVTEMDKRLIFYTRKTLHSVDLASFGYDQNTIFPQGFLKEPKGCFQVAYCKKHLIVYSLDPVKCRK
jgi:hypothetical protein